MLSTQLQNVTGRKTASPLVRDGVELVPNLTHIVSRDQKLYFYYEVYDPTADNGAPQLRTNLAFYRGKVKVFRDAVQNYSIVYPQDILQYEPKSLLSQYANTATALSDPKPGDWVLPRPVENARAKGKNQQDGL